jgi:uncharacterized membrane protein YeaQ/YmgE (transglycosylase-associated protein family)
MVDIIGYIVVGIIAGWLAGVVTRTDRSIWGDLLLGLAGAVVAGLVTDGLMSSDNLLIEVLAATVAAVILVLLKNMLMGGRRTA